MHKVQQILLVFVGVMLLALFGLVAYIGLIQPKEQAAAVPAAAAQPAAEPAIFTFQKAPELRVYCGDLEWYDGARWQSLGSFDALCLTDPLRTEVAAPASTDSAAEAEQTLNHNRALGNVPVVTSGGGGDGGGGGDSGGGGGGGSSGGGGGGAEWSGDYE